MSIRGASLFAYRHLLRLYPREFRERFAAEMLEIAEAAQPAEWPLILGDTGMAAVRSWFNPGKRDFPAVATGPGNYLSLGDSGLKLSALFQGLALATLLVLSACYLSTQTVWNLPSCHVDLSCSPSVVEPGRQ